MVPSILAAVYVIGSKLDRGQYLDRSRQVVVADWADSLPQPTIETRVRALDHAGGDVRR